MTLLPKCSHIPVFALYTVTRLCEESRVAFYDGGRAAGNSVCREAGVPVL